MSNSATPDDIIAVVRLLSRERLKVLERLTGSYESAIELHQETLRLGAALMHVTATVEIALRNAVCENLTAHFGVPNWLTQTPVGFQWRDFESKKIAAAVDSAKRSEYSKMAQAEKAALDVLAYPNGRPPNISHLKRAKDRRRRIEVSEGKVVAELTMFFWKRLSGPDYEQTLWRTTLKRVFPNKKLKRAEIAVQLEIIYQVRNRIAHHEPVLGDRFKAAIDAITFVVAHLSTDPPRADAPLAKLIQDDLKTANTIGANLHDRLESFRSQRAAALQSKAAT